MILEQVTKSALRQVAEKTIEKALDTCTHFLTYSIKLYNCNGCYFCCRAIDMQHYIAYIRVCITFVTYTILYASAITCFI